MRAGFGLTQRVNAYQPRVQPWGWEHGYASGTRMVGMHPAHGWWVCIHVAGRTRSSASVKARSGIHRAPSAGALSTDSTTRRRGDKSRSASAVRTSGRPTASAVTSARASSAASRTHVSGTRSSSSPALWGVSAPARRRASDSALSARSASPAKAARSAGVSGPPASARAPAQPPRATPTPRFERAAMSAAPSVGFGSSSKAARRA